MTTRQDMYEQGTENAFYTERDTRIVAFGMESNMGEHVGMQKAQTIEASRRP
jgi:hypothetical protein